MQKLISIATMNSGRHGRVLLLIGIALLSATLVVQGLLAFGVKLRTPDQIRPDHTRKHLQELDPQLARLAQRTSEIGVHRFWIVQGKRSQSEQDQLYEQGRSRPGQLVTWTRNSKHVAGQAIDFQPLDIEGRPTRDRRAYESVANDFKLVAAELGVRIDWGYDLWKKDLGHIELSTVEGLN
jgi:peptidoglycan L-alanyl-D-glutamate endopeptidase CwlK